MKVLVINGGSSSIKFKVFNMEGEEEILSGLVEKIGLPLSTIIIEYKGQKESRDLKIGSLQEAFSLVFSLFKDKENREKYPIGEIDAIGHRIVHGGESLKTSIVVDDKVIGLIEEMVELAPLHNPAGLIGLKEAKKHFGSLPNTCVFDTSFHQSMPPKAFMYGISPRYYEELKLRRYGFHGTSHMYVSQMLAKHLGKPYESFNCITAHLGNGCSITAIKEGKSVDTSMGFTPLEGVMMGTRSGDIDPAIVGYLATKENKKAEEIITLLNKESGLKGFTGSNDMRDIQKKMAEGDVYAKLASDIFTYRVKKYIGAYLAALDGKVDALIFTGGIGENDDLSRYEITKGLEYAGFVIDKERNQGRHKGITEIGKGVYVVPTNEELQIARDTKRLTA